jgi:hypothetical protein
LLLCPAEVAPQLRLQYPERKSMVDPIACCTGANRERFERELHLLRGYRFKRLLVVGTEAAILESKYYSGISPQCVVATLGAFEVRYDVPIVYSTTPATSPPGGALGILLCSRDGRVCERPMTGEQRRKSGQTLERVSKTDLGEPRADLFAPNL